MYKRSDFEIIKYGDCIDVRLPDKLYDLSVIKHISNILYLRNDGTVDTALINKDGAFIGLFSHAGFAERILDKFYPKPKLTLKDIQIGQKFKYINSNIVYMKINPNGIEHPNFKGDYILLDINTYKLHYDSEYITTEIKLV